MHNTVQNIHYHPHKRVDRSDKVIKISSSIPIHQETEYAIPIELAAKAIEETKNMILAADYKVNFPMELRFVAADDIPMSPGNFRDSCYIGAYVSSLKWAQHYFKEFEALMLDYKGRPHWERVLHELMSRFENFIQPMTNSTTFARNMIQADYFGTASLIAFFRLSFKTNTIVRMAVCPPKELSFERSRKLPGLEALTLH